MGEARKQLSRWKSLEPWPDDLDEIRRRGMGVNISSDPRWITDGHAMFPADGFDLSLLAEVAREVTLRVVTADRIEKLWAEYDARVDVRVAVLGCLWHNEVYRCDCCDDGDWDVTERYLAVLRDELDRLILAAPWKLTFMLHALKPDAITVSAGEIDSALRFMREGRMVGVLMPLRTTGPGPDYMAGYDVDGEPLPLAIELRERLALVAEEQTEEAGKRCGTSRWRSDLSAGGRGAAAAGRAGRDECDLISQSVG